MPLLKVEHRTSFRFKQVVSLSPHRLMVRPREGHTLRIISASLTTEPVAALSWSEDVFGNSVAIATFSGAADYLVINSTAVVQSDAKQWPVFDIAASAIFFP